MLSGLQTRRFFLAAKSGNVVSANRIVEGRLSGLAMSELQTVQEPNAAELALPAIGCPAADEASRHGRELLAAVQPFAREFRVESWWCLGSTLTILALLLGLAAVLPWWPLRLAASVLGGLVLVRTFILYHDFMHGAILRESRLAKLLLGGLGLLMLTPPRYWRYSHNFHHAHVGKPVRPEPGSFHLVTTAVGSFPLMTTHMWLQASFWQRLEYRIHRHPATMLLAYVTVFLIGICLVPLVRNPRKFWDGSLALLVHGGLIAVVWTFAGLQVAFFTCLLPFAIASAMGAYLFFVQHNFERNRILPAEQWSYDQAALESSSYLRMGPLMHWLTGNIGYHHVHHLNSHIPFYRLPETMAAIPELQDPPATSLHPREVLLCLSLNLWDPQQQQLVRYRQATASAAFRGALG
jgi:acyl-lipid omega-6 desaturase (Delta-12 desaturase)